MTVRVFKLVLCAALGSMPVLARPATPPAEADAPAAEVVPTEPAPAEVPQPAASPASPVSPGQVQPLAARTVSGQWVFTRQYGWIWMPHGAAFTYAPPGGHGEPLAYIYYPRIGWTWVAAPWAWGFGPWPHFGALGPRHFAWYAHGWWRTPARWHLVHPRVQGRHVAHGVRPAPRWHGHAHGHGVRRR